MSVHKTIYNSYIVRWRCEGKLNSKTFPRREEAFQFDSKVRLAELPVRKSDGGQMSFAELAKEFIESYSMVSKEESSIKEDQSVLKNHLVPQFGNYRLGMIDFREASEFRAKLVKSGLKRKTINNIFALFKRMFTIAVRWGYLPVNPVLHIEPLKFQAPEMRFWSFEEAEKFLGYAKSTNSNLYDVVAIAINTGLRFGEQRGLMRDAVDFARREIIVKRSYCSRTRKIVQRTKGKKERRVPMNPLVFDILKRRSENSESEEIFKFDLNNFRGRIFVQAMKQAGVPVIRYHDMRHTFASHLVMRGVSLFKVKELMGHGDYKTTLRYTHLAPNQMDGITDVLMSTSDHQNSSRPGHLRAVVF